VCYNFLPTPAFCSSNSLFYSYTQKENIMPDCEGNRHKGSDRTHFVQGSF
jgi:hypothetical protein